MPPIPSPAIQIGYPTLPSNERYGHIPILFLFLARCLWNPQWPVCKDQHLHVQQTACLASISTMPRETFAQRKSVALLYALQPVRRLTACNVLSVLLYPRLCQKQFFPFYTIDNT